MESVTTELESMNSAFEQRDAAEKRDSEQIVTDVVAGVDSVLERRAVDAGQITSDVVQRMLQDVMRSTLEEKEVYAALQQLSNGAGVNSGGDRGEVGRGVPV